MPVWTKELYEGVERQEFINDKEREIKERKKEYARFSKSWQDVNFISWMFDHVEREEKEYEKNWRKDKLKICRIYLKDDKEELIIKIIMWSTGRWILNTLVSQKELWEVEFRIAMDPKSWYSRTIVLNNWKPMEWNFTIEAMANLVRKVTDPETGEVVKTIYDKLEDELQRLSLELKQREEDEEKF